MTDRIEERFRCPSCGGHDVECVDHPTAKGWHQFRCADCGHQSGDHKAVPT